MLNRRKALIVGTIAALAIGVGLAADRLQPTAKAASSSPTPVSTQLAKPGGITPSEPAFIAAAQRLNVSPATLGAAIDSWKMAGGSGSPAAMQALEGKLGVGEAAARAALGDLIPLAAPARPSGLLGDAPVRAFAAALGISDGQARRTLQTVTDWPQKAGGMAVGDPRFDALARSLGVSTDKLAAGLDQAKMALGQK
jgi:hypothetical protein